MTRNENHDDDDESSRKRSKTHDNGGVAPWSHLNHDVLFLVIMQFGVIVFVAFSGVCKSWRSFALSNKKKFMVSRPPMSIRFSTHGYCCLKDFEGRKFKTILPDTSGRICVGSTCGYLILFAEETKDFLLVNPITRHQLHFPAFPFLPELYILKAILVFSPSINEWVFLVSHKNSRNLWFSKSGKGAWNLVHSDFFFLDLHAYKGKIYTLHDDYFVSELRLNPKPKLTLLEITNFPKRYVFIPVFVSSGENLYAIDQSAQDSCKVQELDFGEMKWVSPNKKTIGEYAFFLRLCLIAS